MLTLDIFRQDAFSAVTMTEAIQDTDHMPGLLGSMNIFETESVNTSEVLIQNNNQTLALVPAAVRGSPPTRRERDRRKMRMFSTSQLGRGETITASYLSGMRAFGNTSELALALSEVAKAQQRVIDDISLTREHMMLGAIQGKVLDADGSILNDYFAEFGISEPGVVLFDLDNATPETPLKITCGNIRRAVQRSAKGAWVPGTTLVALCGDEYFDKIVAHPEIEKTYANWLAAADMRGPTDFRDIVYGGIHFINYQGTDDNSTIAVPVDEAIFFPKGGKDVFKVYHAPDESLEFVNTPGQELYSYMEEDKSARKTYVDAQVFTHPLYACCKPAMLRKGKIGAP